MSALERVPWMCKEEWEFCRDNLFGGDVSMRRRALEHLYIWKIRCINLPIAVECTLILLDVHLKGNDRNLDNEEMFTNTMNYESWYSVAIMRFLNLITDSNVGGKASSSMNQLARLYDIPEWIVDIRHAVAHGPLLPSLSSLKEAVEKCLSWLYESYWSKNMYEDYIQNSNECGLSSTFSCFEICLLLKKYLSFGFQTMLDIPVSDRENINQVLPKNSQNQNFSAHEWSLMEIHKYTLKKLGRHLKRNTDYGKNLVLSILENDQYLLSPNGIKDNKLSEQVVSLWSDIIVVICESSICYHFLQELVTIVNSPVESSLRQHCAALYLKTIARNVATWKRRNSEIENNENNNNKRKKLKKKTSFLNVSDHLSGLSDVKLTEEEISSLIHLALNKPNERVRIFLKDLLSLSNAATCMTKYDELMTLIDKYTGHRLDVEDCTLVNDIRTVQEFLGKSYQSRVDHVFPELEEETIMNKIPENTKNYENEWKNTPLGFLPWQRSFQPWLYIYDPE